VYGEGKKKNEQYVKKKTRSIRLKSAAETRRTTSEHKCCASALKLLERLHDETTYYALPSFVLSLYLQKPFVHQNLGLEKKMGKNKQRTEVALRSGPFSS